MKRQIAAQTAKAGNKFPVNHGAGPSKETAPNPLASIDSSSDEEQIEEIYRETAQHMDVDTATNKIEVHANRQMDVDAAPNPIVIRANRMCATLKGLIEKMHRQIVDDGILAVTP